MTEPETAAFAKGAYAAVLRFPSPHTAVAAADDAALAEAAVAAYLCVEGHDHDHRLCHTFPDLARAKAQRDGWLPITPADVEHDGT